MRQINLLPESLQQAEQMRLLRNVAVVICIVSLGAALVLHMLLSFGVNTTRANVDQSLMAHQDEFVRIKQEIQNAKGQMKDLYSKEEVLILLLSKHLSNAHMLKVMGQLTGERVWLTGLNLDIQKSECELEGRSFSTRLVSEFMLELKRMPYFREVELINMDKGKSTEVTFKILCHLS